MNGVAQMNDVRLLVRVNRLIDAFFPSGAPIRSIEAPPEVSKFVFTQLVPVCFKYLRLTDDPQHEAAVHNINVAYYMLWLLLRAGHTAITQLN